MQKGFWGQLKKPVLCLAPMEDVTDAAFRYVIAKYCKSQSLSNPITKYVTFSEFTSADGLVRAGERGQAKLRAKLRFHEIERPIVAQLFGSKPEYMEQAAALVQELGFDGVDINMGCPDKTVERQGAGAALIKTPDLAVKLIEAAKRGAPQLPVSVKTRIGYNKDETDTWVPALLDTGIAALTLHARTRKEMSNVPAQWKTVARAVEIRDEIQRDVPPANRTLIIGNGDLVSVDDARNKVKQYGSDGAMLGRAMFGNPFVFSNSRELENSPEAKLRVLGEHAELFEKHFAGIKSFAVMKKHFSSYVSSPTGGFASAKELRIKLMECENAADVRQTISPYLE
jgi:nifR3 family TIM-barrel protein